MTRVAESPKASEDGPVTTPPAPAATDSPGAAYAGRLAAQRDEQCRLARRYGLLSGCRRLLLGALVLLVLLVEREGPLAKLVLVGAPALLLEHLIRRRARVARSMWAVQWLAGFYEQRLACVEERWAGTGEPGTRYLDADHPAAADLDLFGVGGLFERLATPCTRAGADTLAGWLLAPAGAAEVRDRQAAVAELRGRLDLREELAYLAGQVAASSELAQVARWGRAAPVLATPAARALGALTLSLTAAALLGGLFFNTGAAPVLIALGLQAAFAVALRRRAGAALGPLEGGAYDLAALGRLFARLERERFTAPRLVKLRAELTAGPASRRVARLHRLRHGAPWAQVLASRPQMAMLLDCWRQASGPAFGRWLAALGEVEALCALAAYRYECPDDPFPEVLEAGAVFEAETLGHPLLPRAHCVRNDLSLGDGSRVLIVSGSNMSGKSTLLRTAGVNAVLALAGAPVRAERLRLSPLVVGATLRIQDSLLAGRSRFQAEVLRVRRLLRPGAGRPAAALPARRAFPGDELGRPPDGRRGGPPPARGRGRRRPGDDARPRVNGNRRPAGWAGGQRPLRGPLRQRGGHLRLPHEARGGAPHQRPNVDAGGRHRGVKGPSVRKGYGVC
jgi:MutS domain V